MGLLKKNGYLEKLSDEEFFGKYNTSADTFFKEYPSDKSTSNINVRLQFYQNEFLRRETRKTMLISHIISIIAIIIAIISILIKFKPTQGICGP
jgi:hypothetical protein